MRFWRNTSIAALAPGQVATLLRERSAMSGNDDTDNGFRPAGLFPLSTTTLAVSNYYRDSDFRSGNGTATHHLTLYRHASGALVFGAGHNASGRGDWRPTTITLNGMPAAVLFRPLALYTFRPQHAASDCKPPCRYGDSAFDIAGGRCARDCFYRHCSAQIGDPLACFGK